MIEKLKEHGLSEYTLNKISSYDEVLLSELETNIDEIEKIIFYLKMIGIKNLDEVILYKPQILLASIDRIKYLFNSKDINSLILEINEDFTNIDELFE